jgi:hypothetical protein
MQRAKKNIILSQKTDIFWFSTRIKPLSAFIPICRLLIFRRKNGESLWTAYGFLPGWRYLITWNPIPAKEALEMKGQTGYNKSD